MRATLGTVASGHVEAAAAFAFDAASSSTGVSSGPSAPSFTWTHTPVGIPKGIVVLAATENSSGANQMTQVADYGGVAMTEVALSPFLATMTSEEDATLNCYFLGSGIPTGSQTVRVYYGGGASSCNASAFSVIGPNDSAVEDTTTADTSGANPTCALTIDEESFVCAELFSGQDTSAGVTAGAGMTVLRQVDVGPQTLSVARKTALVSSNTTVDWTATSEEYAIFAIAIKST